MGAEPRQALLLAQTRVAPKSLSQDSAQELPGRSPAFLVTFSWERVPSVCAMLLWGGVECVCVLGWGETAQRMGERE